VKFREKEMPISIALKKCRWPVLLAGSLAFALMGFVPLIAQTPVEASPGYLVHDGHVHLTNYIQEGPNVSDFLKVMGTKVGRAVLFGLPLQ
jgi:hypothetical protein